MANAALPVVPIIDIAPYRTGGEADKDRVAAAVDRACRDTGFIVITGHGVAPALLARAFGACEAFFALPSADKRRTANATGTRGYQVLGGQGLAHSLGEETPPDLFEGFSLGQVDVPDDAYHRAAAATFFEPNLWPPAPADFEPAIRAYYRAMADLAAILMRLFARALGLPEAAFDGVLDRHISHLRLTHYPAQATPPLPGQLRAGAHSDYGSLTIVCPTDAPGGLQVQAKDGTWQDVPFVAGSFVINLGDLMAVWTNDRWVSTMHRVANPPREQATRARRSLVFFHQPNHDASIACIETCQDADNPPRYEPVKSGEWLMMKVARQMLDGTAAS